MFLWFLDGTMFGGISLNLHSKSHTSRPTAPSFPGVFLIFVQDVAGIDLCAGDQVVPSTPEIFSFVEYLSPFTFGLFSSLGTKDDHLLGQHTVRMSPMSTAQLNPQGLSYCLSPTSNFVLIPVLLNNTNLSGLRYSFTPHVEDPFDHTKKEIVDLTAKDLKAIEQLRVELLQVSQHTPLVHDADEYDEYDDDETEKQNPHSSLQKTQSLVHIKLSKPGILRLESVSDSSDTNTRIAFPSVLTVALCPSVEFIDEGLDKENTRCVGEDSDLRLMINVRGVPPLSLRWLKTVNGKREHFLVEGIQNESDRDLENDRPIATIGNVPQEVKIPLSVSLDAPGTYLYALEEVTDGIGNVIRVGSDTVSPDSGSITQTKTTRSLMVLRRAAFSFKNCRPGSATSLLIGSEAPLTISATEFDGFDSTWEITLGYQPAPDLDTGRSKKRYKPWKKPFKTEAGRKELTVLANAPGDYTILGVRGKVCEVFYPETGAHSSLPVVLW